MHMQRPAVLTEGREFVGGDDGHSAILHRDPQASIAVGRGRIAPALSCIAGYFHTQKGSCGLMG